MRSSFSGIEISRRALLASQGALDVVNHNTANANTPGFSRQVASLQTTSPYTVPGIYKSPIPGQVGTGVEIQSITRVRDAFTDRQYRRENKSMGYWTTQEESLSKLEGVFNEPSDTGFQTVLNRFWESLQELSKNPQMDAVRATVRQRGVDLTESFKHTYDSLVQQQADLNAVIEINVQDINSTTLQIRDLNSQILKVEAVGEHANDLRDRRDLLLDSLSKLINVQVNEDQYGVVTVSTVGQTLIQGNFVFEMDTDTTMGPNGQELVRPIWQGTGVPVVFDSGAMQGLLDARDNSTVPPATDGKNGIQGYIDQLNMLANSIMTDINAIHQTGYGIDAATTTGLDFFVLNPVSTNYAKDLKLNTAILLDPKLIAASSTAEGVPGNGDNAIMMAQRLTQTSAILGGVSLGDYYNGMIAQLGVDTQAAKRFNENQDLLVASIENRRQSVSGVSLDEEMTNMIKYQKTYSSAARMMTTYDEMLDTIINRMGRVGN